MRDFVGSVCRGAALAFVLTVAPRVEAQGSCVDEVQGAFDQGEFERAFEVLSRCDPPTARLDREHYLRLRGMVAYGLSDVHPDAERIAREAFEELLRMDPHARLPEGTSPRFEVFLARIRIEGGFGRPVVTLRLEPVTEPGALDIVLRGDHGRVDGLLAWFRRSEGAYEEVAADCVADRCRIVLPASLASGGSLEGYVIAHAGSEDRLHWLGNLGTEEAPFTYVPASRSEGPSTAPSGSGKKLLWTAIGVGVGAAVVTAVITVLLANREPTFSCPSSAACREVP